MPDPKSGGLWIESSPKFEELLTDEGRTLPPPSPSEALGSRHLTCCFSRSAPQPCATETPTPSNRRLRQALDRLPKIRIRTVWSTRRANAKYVRILVSEKLATSPRRSFSIRSISHWSNRHHGIHVGSITVSTSAPLRVPVAVSALWSLMLLCPFRILRSIRFAWLRRLFTSPRRFRPGFDLDSPRRSPQRLQRIERIAVRFRGFGTMAWAVSSLLALNSFLPPTSTNTFRRRFGARFRESLARDSGKDPRDLVRQSRVALDPA